MVCALEIGEQYSRIAFSFIHDPGDICMFNTGGHYQNPTSVVIDDNGQNAEFGFDAEQK